MTDEKTESGSIVVAQDSAIIPIVQQPNDIVVLASKPGQLEVANASLIQWFAQKIVACKAELQDAEDNFALAKKRKWSTGGWQRRVTLSRQAVSYYEKAEAALKAGYCLVPDFPVDIIAIRTTRSTPANRVAESGYRHPSISEERTTSPKIGVGEYVSPNVTVVHGDYTKTVKDKVEKVYTAEAHGFLPPDFPYKVIKPQILDDTSRAMAFKIFDEIGVVSRPSRRGDPIVVGRIKRTISNRNERTMSFLLAWWIDTRDL